MRRLLSWKNTTPPAQSLRCSTRTCPEIADLIGKDSCVIEYGSGSSLKIRKLLEALLPSAYVPVDISRDYLLSTATALSDDFCDLSVFPVCADFTQDMALPTQVEALRRVGFFPGSSIGNFEPAQAREFIQQVGDTLGAGGYFWLEWTVKKIRGFRAGLR